MNWKIGQPLVCVDDSNQWWGGLVKNNVYHLRAYCESRLGEIGVLLEEIKMENHPETGREIGHKASRFTSLDDVADISELIESLNEPAYQ